MLEKDFSYTLTSRGRFLILTRIFHLGAWLTMWGFFKQSQFKQLRVCMLGNTCR